MHELAGRARRSVAGGLRSALSPASMRGATVECVWVAAHLALYPLGVVRERTGVSAPPRSPHDLPPAQRGLLVGGVEAAATPILLVHGMADNRSIFPLLRRGLRRRGFGAVATHSYGLLTTDVRAAARQLAQRVEELCEQTGYERVHVVGHSLGGLIARYYVQRLGGDARVHTLVTLGTPHQGTLSARLLPTRLPRQLRPDSDLMRELAEPVTCRTRFLAYWSDLDQVVVPRRNARLEHDDLSVTNVLVRGVGHMSLPIDGRVVHGICTALAHLTEDGATVATGFAALGGAEQGPQHGSPHGQQHRPRDRRRMRQGGAAFVGLRRGGEAVR